LVFSAVLCFFSCSKEKVIPNFPTEAISSNSPQVSDRGPGTIGVADARLWFTTAYGQEKLITQPSILSNKTLRVAPVWAFAQTATYLGLPVVICPIQQPTEAHYQSRYLLVLYRPADNQIAAQVVVFREVNDTGVSGKPLTLGDFSGIIASLDLQANYVGKVHLIRDGVQFGEIDPYINRNGFVNGNGSNGNIYYQQPIWSDDNNGQTIIPTPSPTSGSSSGGSWYVVGGSVHITIYGTTFNNGFNPGAYTPIIGGGGGTVPGSPTTNSLDNHFQNLLNNPLFTFEEYLSNNDIYEGTFEFLNNSLKIILANRTNFIDLFNDFLIAANNSSTAQALVSEIITQIAQYNLTSLTVEQINALLTSMSHNNEVVVTIGPNEPGISPANPMCPGMFDFTYNNGQTKQSGGIRNLKISLLLNGVMTNFLFPTVYFESNNMGVCPESFNKKAADAINAATTKTIQRITDNTLYGPSSLPINDRIKGTFHSELFFNFEREVNECAPANGKIPTQVALLSALQWIDYNMSSNTVFRDFFTDFQTYCP